MTTRFDMQDAEERYLAHIGEHSKRRNPNGTFQTCKLGDGCEERLKLWQAWMDTAARWGEEAGDKDRQRRQFWERFPNAAVI